MENLKILLVCSGRFALPVMRDLVYQRSLAAVIIPSFCKEMLEETQQLLQTTGIPVIQVNKQNHENELKKAIRKYDAAMVFMMTFRYKITKAVFDLPSKGFYNFHPGSLPEYRGADPIFMQLKNQEKYAGVTVHKLDEGFDTGPIVIKEMIKIDASDTYGILNNKLAELASKLAGILIKMAAFDLAIPSKPQDETKAGYFTRQSSKEIVIDWETMNAGAIISLVNACNPWNKGAVTSINNKIVRLLNVEKTESEEAVTVLPGTVLSINESNLSVAVIGQHALRINFIYIDEGFLRAGSLLNLGVRVGSKFQNL